MQPPKWILAKFMRERERETETKRDRDKNLLERTWEFAKEQKKEETQTSERKGTGQF